ncbi:MAG: alpha/beta hydrolase [Mycobacteriaceae bacterium]|nr:alpha/beta hydrolase [Mycobacteriaceae bacterium]MBV9638214.1 alpha/beta hydrolase [Mycobacteriaceae bacterium]
MTQTSVVSATAPERRIRLVHHQLELDDGHRVGVSVGGAGVPLVFLHGLALSRRAYVRMLSRVAGLGFLVIAVDAAGHGDTRRLPRNAADLADVVDLTVRTLDALGVRQAIFAGHSMGGRMTIQLAAVAPERVLAAVLFDAAAGASFDETVPGLLSSPRRALRAVIGAAYDTHKDPSRLEAAERGSYLRMLASIAGRNARHPVAVAGAARAIVQSGDYTPMLRVLRDQNIPTMVLHGEKDLIVPFGCAVDMADDADGSLYKVPDAYHSWMIANPRQGADAMRQLLHGELGEVLRNTADTMGIGSLDDTAAWQRALLEPDAFVLELNGDAVDEVGVEEPQHVELELVRQAERPQHAKRMAWLRRTYKRWTGRYSEPGRSTVRWVRPDARAV